MVPCWTKGGKMKTCFSFDSGHHGVLRWDGENRTTFHDVHKVKGTWEWDWKGRARRWAFVVTWQMMTCLGV